VLFSGDKLLGGPQAGVLAGTTDAVQAAVKHPLARALRLDGSAIVGICATLEMYADRRILDIPFWAMASLGTDDIDLRAHEVLSGTSGATVVDGESIPGAGSAPGATIPTRLIKLPGPAESVYGELSRHDPPIISSRRDTSTLIDLRSVLPADDLHVADALRKLLS
jgi:L-seryl-tRNA(Ser) seleniumtransferase